MRLRSFNLFMQEHNKNKDDQLRLGQRFVVFYTLASWPDLFYADETKAIILIQRWLIDHQYIDELPARYDMNYDFKRKVKV